MSEHITDAMVDAADRAFSVPRNCPCGAHWEPLSSDYREAIAAALAAAPTADVEGNKHTNDPYGWVWCEATRPHGMCPYGMVQRAGHRDEWGTPCPGPHRTLILGPEVER